MGMIRIETLGSFGVTSKTFSAMEHGHANAVAEAIAWLAEDLLPRSVSNDHACQSEGEFPRSGFTKMPTPVGAGG